ncbi:NUDIX domain-containing protein [Rhizobium sp. SSA_523]|uniref:NUDIX domain-containing protein n=1 Tax=Rhizobium sp. SSA_523 TaxID=2952477 RepID=UPI00209050CB|nr:NUDIX domain-containing protein [Rhizobium sp. SSA_523]MCO5730618.1 NUDIX domain-containing protein [Rhizobium sp. SSA_523]WKC24551.1 NUDIX domain-containing protein [Rhizobium sp. SSA_523]
MTPGLQPVAEGAQGQAQRTEPLRPKPSASLILIDRSGPTKRVLVGRRASGHAFMPDLYVFPGGRRDLRDHALPFAKDLHPAVLDILLRRCSPRLTPAGARALALAALRELREETGLSLGPQAGSEAPYRPDLSSLRLIGRAVTPPGAVRRFDNRFFATFVDEAQVDLGNLQSSTELTDFHWLDLAALDSVRLPPILTAVAGDLKILLESEPSLPFGSQAYAYSFRKGEFVRHRL